MSLTSPSPPPALPGRRRRFLGPTAIALILLILGGCLAENYRGHYLWQRYRKEWEGKGERFDLRALVPKPVPPEQNFAATPFFKPYLDYSIEEADHQHPYHWRDKLAYERNRALIELPSDSKLRKATEAGQWQVGTFTDFGLWQTYFQSSTNFLAASPQGGPATAVLTALSRYNAPLEEIRAAGTRPFSVFPVHYQEGYQALLPHLAGLKNLGQIVCLRASAELETGNASDALKDIELGFRLADALESERFLISTLVRIRLIGLSLQPIWEGLARQRWTDHQIEEIQSTLARLHVLEDYAPTMRMERAAALFVVDQLRTGQYHQLGPSGDADETNTKDYAAIRHLPGGVFRQNQLTIARLYQERLLPAVDNERHFVDVLRVNRAGAVRESERYHPYRLFAHLLVPWLSHAADRFARAQAEVDLALVACALERYRLQTGRYPDVLANLTPNLLAAVPPDVVATQPLKYRLTKNNGFLLYSIGWNQIDDGGTPGKTTHREAFDPRKGDWVWRYPGMTKDSAP